MGTRDTDGPEESIVGSTVVSTTDEAAWREAVTKTLKGRGPEELGAMRADGVRIEPLYTERHTASLEARGLPGEAPFVRGSRASGVGFRVVQRYDVGSVEAAKEELGWDLAGGTEGVWIAFDQAARGRLHEGAALGDEAWGRRGVPVGSEQALAALLAPVELASSTIVLEAGAAGGEVLGWFEAICERRGVAASSVDLVLFGDPLATLAELGELPLDREGLARELGKLVRARAGFGGDARTLGVSGLVYQEAGATASEQLGLVLGAAAEALRLGAAQGLDASEVLGSLAVGLAADEDVFATIALVRAARLALAKLAVAAGAEPVRPRLLGLGSARSFTLRDAQDNLLRATTQSYGLALGGVDLLATLPFDHAAGRSDRLARRVARNQAFVLREEGHVARVADPAGGAYYLEALTDATARAAWEVFREIEREGGLSAALVAGSVQARLTRSRKARAKLFASRKRVIVGLSEFALPTESATTRPAKRAPRATGVASVLGLSASEGSLRAAPLVLRRDAEPFEALRDRADGMAERGPRPRALLVALGEPADHRARAGFARRFFEVGGFEIHELEIDGEAALAAPGRDAVVSGADVVCLCSSDARYAELGAGLFATLARAGAKELSLAGRPGELEAALRGAGLVHALFVGCDAPRVLGAMLDGVEKARGGVS